MKEEDGHAAMEAAAQQAELAAYDQRVHVLEVQGALEEEAQDANTKQLLAAADLQFQDALASAQTRSKEFKALTLREAEETREEVEVLRKTLEQVRQCQHHGDTAAPARNGEPLTLPTSFQPPLPTAQYLWLVVQKSTQGHAFLWT